MMYSSHDQDRREDIVSKSGAEKEEYRTTWRRDYGRLVHSPCFRRLQGKTQLYPGTESDFFRNRLTHSIEVAQIAKSIAIRINHRYGLIGTPNEINLDLVEFSALAHDLGHPPFGHQGEDALDDCMIDNGGFEGNAQTLRILSKLEKRNTSNPADCLNEESKLGLNLTYRTLASILKYDNIIPETKAEREVYATANTEGKRKPVKGYYTLEGPLVSKIKEQVCKGREAPVDPVKFKSVECQIMDIADDIAYSTYDLEDSFKAGFINPFDMLFSEDRIKEKVLKKITKPEHKKIELVGEIIFSIFQRLFDLSNEKMERDEFYKNFGEGYLASNNLTSNGVLRTNFTSNLVGDFIRGVDFTINKGNVALSTVVLNDDTRLKVEILKTFVFESQIESPRLKIAEYRGKEIVKKIFTTLDNEKDKGYELMPLDCRGLYEQALKENASQTVKRRIICDYISGMTDKYAIEFYGRLTSEDPATIFKPF